MKNKNDLSFKKNKNKGKVEGGSGKDQEWTFDLHTQAHTCAYTHTNIHSYHTCTDTKQLK